jgi:hypothetical protein
MSVRILLLRERKVGRGMAIRDDIRKFGRTSAWLAGIAGLYLGAKALHADWVFFAVLALAGVIVIIARRNYSAPGLRGRERVDCLRLVG